jgi:hypothetical protein
MSYAPLHRPDTIAWKSVRYLETLPKGAEILCSKLAEAIGVDTKLIQPSMLAAVAAGQVFRRQKDDHARSPWWYSLTDYSKIPRAAVQRVVVPDDAKAVDAPSTPARKAATARTTPNGAAEGATPNDGSTSAPIELHMVVRVTHAQAEAIVQLLGRSA